MFVCFRYYRHRRLLPFAAVFALVFINGATLAPFVPPQALAAEQPAEGSASLPDGSALAQADDAWRWLQYERGQGDPPGPVVTAGPPPVVKNLRRASHAFHVGCPSHRPVGRLDDAPAVDPRFVQRALAANAADLSRLCRLLL